MAGCHSRQHAGRRFYDETGRQFTPNIFGSLTPYEQGSYRNAKNIKYNPSNFINAALAGIGDGQNGGGPIWAIFDTDAVARETWDPTPPHVDTGAGFFFSANSIEELAAKIVMKHQRVPMPPENLASDRVALQPLRRNRRGRRLRKARPRYKIASRRSTPRGRRR